MKMTMVVPGNRTYLRSLLGLAAMFVFFAAGPAPDAAAQTPPADTPPGTIHVIKRVINSYGGTKKVADFPLFVNDTPVVSGVTNGFPASAAPYVVSEISDPRYTRSFSGDCDLNGRMVLEPGASRYCFLTNDDIGSRVGMPASPPVPPLIDVVIVPDPLFLPTGPGGVTYAYALRNFGTVPVTDITMIGDTCSPIVLVSGDSDADAGLDVNETWTYRCATDLSETHTSTVVATGWANGLTATDVASATVLVGVPLAPPLIHVTTVPSPLTLPAGGGTVTYTESITNPGAVPLGNVSLNDDRCAMNYVSGDANGDAKLDTDETWTYTCATDLAKTTTNTVMAIAEANGYTVRDFAIATVVVAPKDAKLYYMQLLYDWIVASLAVLISAYVLPGVSVAGFGTAMLVALALGIINAFVRPFVLLLTLPINLLTLGLFTFVVNALMVLLAARLVPGFKVRSFWHALLFSLVLSIVAALLFMVFG